MKNISVIEHPIVKYLITKLRNKNTSPELYRIYTNRIANFLIYEALESLETVSLSVDTQTKSTYNGDKLKDDIAFITILRAGLSMFVPALENYPEAQFHAVGMKRDVSDPFNTKPEFYLDKLDEISKGVKQIVIVDPMLATGGTLASLLDAIRNKYMFSAKINIVCLIAAKIGVEKILSQFPDVKITCAGFDETLNENGYIIPGLGDAGDRYFGVNQ